MVSDITHFIVVVVVLFVLSVVMSQSDDRVTRLVGDVLVITLTVTCGVGSLLGLVFLVWGINI